jgi:RNA polymerase sigma-70 factor (ECF subfamily)
MNQATTDNLLDPPGDAPLLPDVAAGDRAAVNRCIRRYGPLVWSLARRLSPTAEDAEDAVQEIFINIWRYAARFDRTRGSEKVFIAVIARRTLIDRLRSMKSRLAAETPIDPESEQEGPPTQRAERDAEVEQARQILGQLPLPQQRVIALSLVHGLSHGEIASRLGMPLGTVKTLLRRGIQRVQGSVNEEDTP